MKILLKSNLFMALSLAFLVSVSCSVPKPWPESPLYDLPPDDAGWVSPATKEEAMQAMAGHYAHYDIVAYDAVTPNGPLSTFVITYGYTDLVMENGELVEYDRFCHAEHKANQNMQTRVPDAATQAILPRSSVVEVYEEDGIWKLYRPATPTLIGIDGDPDRPLSTDKKDPLITDPDGDGNPGITIYVKIFGFIKGEIYLARREIFENELALYPDGSLRGTVIDNSEQLVLGASLGILDVPNNPPQWKDPGLNPLILIPVPDTMDTCEELMANRDLLFPPEPEF